jgi:FeS assembly protein IscX
MALTWSDSGKIAKALSDKEIEVDFLNLDLQDLKAHVQALDDFSDSAEPSDYVLESIKTLWLAIEHEADGEDSRYE